MTQDEQIYGSRTRDGDCAALSLRAFRSHPGARRCTRQVARAGARRDDSPRDASGRRYDALAWPWDGLVALGMCGLAVRCAPVTGTGNDDLVDRLSNRDCRWLAWDRAIRQRQWLLLNPSA